MGDDFCALPYFPLLWIASFSSISLFARVAVSTLTTISTARCAMWLSLESRSCSSSLGFKVWTASPAPSELYSTTEPTLHHSCQDYIMHLFLGFQGMDSQPSTSALFHN